eukprot:scaffold67833_cov49-Phaeocystis_antarctica.AAC.2
MVRIRVRVRPTRTRTRTQTFLLTRTLAEWRTSHRLIRSASVTPLCRHGVSATAARSSWLGVRVRVGVGARVGVRVAVRVWVGVGVRVGVRVAVSVRVRVRVKVRVKIRVATSKRSPVLGADAPDTARSPRTSASWPASAPVRRSA